MGAGIDIKSVKQSYSQSPIRNERWDEPQKEGGEPMKNQDSLQAVGEPDHKYIKFRLLSRCGAGNLGSY